MAQTPKSPKGDKKDGKDEPQSFFEKLGTLGRKKRSKEAADLQTEGKQALEDLLNPRSNIDPASFAMEEGSERIMINPRSQEDPKFQELVQLLLDWINDELADQRIVVKDIAEDLFDGQILQKLVEKLKMIRVEAPEVTQSEMGQRQKLTVVLAVINRDLGIPPNAFTSWSVENIHGKSLLAIIQLLVALTRHFRAPVRLPEHVIVTIDVIEMKEGKLIHNTMQQDLTGTAQDLGLRSERDAFDTLIEHAPDKLNVVVKSLIAFVNKHLSKINLEVDELETQMSDGVYLVLLMGLLEGYFVPLYEFHLTPSSFDQKVHNISLAFDLMEDGGLERPKARPEDIANRDLKSTLRVLYNLVANFKHL